jgi:hypothetical protein
VVAGVLGGVVVFCDCGVEEMVGSLWSGLSNFWDLQYLEPCLGCFGWDQFFCRDDGRVDA